MHNEFITIDETKVGKSLGNSIYLSDIENKFSPLAYRYLLLSVHYRSKMSFSYIALDASQQALNRLIEFAITTKNTGKIIEQVYERVSESIRNDLNTPSVLSIVWDMVRNDKYKAEDRKMTLFKIDELLGLNIEKSSKLPIPNEIKEMVKERNYYRKNRQWKEADDIRDKVFTQGFHLKDTDKDTIIIPK